MDECFYKHFYKEVFEENGDQTNTTKHMILLLAWKYCNLPYPVTYEYAKVVLI